MISDAALSMIAVTPYQPYADIAAELLAARKALTELRTESNDSSTTIDNIEAALGDARDPNLSLYENVLKLRGRAEAQLAGVFDVYAAKDGGKSYIQIKPEFEDAETVRLYTAPPAQSATKSAEGWSEEISSLRGLAWYFNDRELDLRIERVADGFQTVTAGGKCTPQPAQAVSAPVGSAKIMLSLQDLGVLKSTAVKNEKINEFVDIAVQWAMDADAEIRRLKAQAVSVPNAVEVFAAFDAALKLDEREKWTGAYKNSSASARAESYRAWSRVNDLRAMLAAAPSPESPC